MGTVRNIIYGAVHHIEECDHIPKKSFKTNKIIRYGFITLTVIGVAAYTPYWITMNCGKIIESIRMDYRRWKAGM